MRTIFWKNSIQFLTVLTSLINCQIDDDIKISVKLDPDRESRFLAAQLTDTDVLKPQYDYIIIGAGSAGCVVTNRLSEIQSASILLIEAGGYESLKMDVPSQVPNLFQTHVDWQYETDVCKNCGFGAPVKQKFLISRGKVLGGSSTINGMVYTRGNPADFDTWEEKYKNPGWSFRHVEKYFKKLENYTIFDQINRNYFGRNGPQYVSALKYESGLAKPAFKAALEYGFPATNMNGPNQVGVSFLQATMKDGFRVSTNSAYLLPIKGRKNVDLKINCQVTKVLITESNSTLTAHGVNFSCKNGQNYTVLAQKEVILSAGAYNTPQILMLSGVGPKDHLQELGIKVVKDLPVGNNYIDQVLALGLQFLVDKPLLPSPPLKDTLYNGTGVISLPSSTEVLIFSNPVNKSPTIETYFVVGSIAPSLVNEEIYNKIYKPYENQTSFNIYPFILKPESRGYVRLRNSDPFSKPRIIPNHLSTQSDVDFLVKAVKQALAISRQPSLQKLGTRSVNGSLPNCSQYKYGSDEYLRCYVKTMTLPAYHACGTCKMGSEDDATTVVDSELRVHGIKNLRVVDASIMPEIISGQTNSPTIMIGEKGADIIKGVFL